MVAERVDMQKQWKPVRRLLGVTHGEILNLRHMEATEYMGRVATTEIFRKCWPGLYRDIAAALYWGSNE